MPPVTLPNITSRTTVEPTRVRCFVTAIEVDAPERSLYTATVHYKADHAYTSEYRGSFSASDGRDYKVGDVLWVTIER